MQPELFRRVKVRIHGGIKSTFLTPYLGGWFGGDPCSVMAKEEDMYFPFLTLRGRVAATQALTIADRTEHAQRQRFRSRGLVELSKSVDRPRRAPPDHPGLFRSLSPSHQKTCASTAHYAFDRLRQRRPSFCRHVIDSFDIPTRDGQGQDGRSNISSSRNICDIFVPQSISDGIRSIVGQTV